MRFNCCAPVKKQKEKREEVINIDKSRVLVKDPLSKFHTVSLCLKIHYQIAIDAARFGKRVERERANGSVSVDFL